MIHNMLSKVYHFGILLTSSLGRALALPSLCEVQNKRIVTYKQSSLLSSPHLACLHFIWRGGTVSDVTEDADGQFARFKIML